ncbi:unnamed protein product [Miscanthus lutarioriparius]|uniref:FACT complex subunit n=1 Tax=Miscanthus lutarioriparius TaxID=422564 RepID=A0A811Q6E6_9POAL|nr:unnamed protein product [Miscanthus lutarioriparius]
MADNGSAKGGTGAYTINLENFSKRLKVFYDHWKEHKSDLWRSSDAIVIATPALDAPPHLKSVALEIWLLGYEFPETIIVFMKNQIHVLCSQKKAKLIGTLEKAANEAVGADIVLHVKTKNTDGSDLMDDIVRAAQTRSKSDKPVVGHIAKEVDGGKLLQTWASKLSSYGIRPSDVTNGFSELFAVKDTTEITCVKKAAYLTSSVLENFVVPKLMKVITEEEKVSHSLLRDETVKAILDLLKIKVKLNPDNVDICYPPVFQSGGKFDLKSICYPPVSQSGGKFDLKPGASSKDEYLYYDSASVIICAIGSKYSNYCSNVARTYLIDASPAQSKAYETLLKAHEAAVGKVKPGSQMSAVYQAARAVIERDAPELLPNLTMSAGSGIGLEFQESVLNLNANNDGRVKQGMVFNVFLGLHNIQAETTTAEKTKQFSLLLADTVLVNERGPSILTAPCSKAVKDVAYQFIKDAVKMECMKKIMNMKENIRNICIFGPGQANIVKALSSDPTLLAPEMMSDAIARGDEPVALYYRLDKGHRDTFLVNVTQCPEVTDSSMEFNASLSIVDRALIRVELNEGFTLQCESFLRQALYENNLLDDVTFDPRKANVCFSSSSSGWAFTLNDLARFWSPILGVDHSLLVERLWGENFYDLESKKWSKVHTETSKRGFPHFCINLIMIIYQRCLKGDQGKIEALFFGDTIKDQQQFVGKVGISLYKEFIKKFLPAESGPHQVLVTKTLQGHSRFPEGNSKIHLTALENVGKEGGIVLTTYETIRDHKQKISDKLGTVDYIFADEGHRIKNKAGKASKALKGIRCDHRIVVTGTPIQNNLMEFYSLMKFCNPTLLGNKEEFKETFLVPIDRGKFKGSTPSVRRKAIESSEDLNKLVSPFVLRRSKMTLKDSGRIKANKYEVIVWVKISAHQANLYEALMVDPNPRSRKHGGAFEISKVAKSLCLDPSIVGMTSAKNISQQFKRTLVKTINTSTRELTSSKLSFLLYFLPLLLNDKLKILVFSTSPEMLQVLEEALSAKINEEIIRMDGTMSCEDRVELIENFQRKDGPPIFLLTTKVGGVGITLTAASRVVIIDPSDNPCDDNQAVDRAYRIGQVRVVIVYHLITCGTIEEHTYRRQTLKLETSDDVLEGTQVMDNSGKTCSKPIVSSKTRSSWAHEDKPLFLQELRDVRTHFAVAIGCEKWLPGGRKFYALGIAAICWAIWKARDKTCFGGKLLKNPIEILCHPCAIPQEDDQDGDDD